jgi:Pentapeptide repeats (8 copies)
VDHHPEGTDSPGANTWKPDELELRRQEVTSQRRGTWLQAFIAIAALAAALAAVYVSINASRAIDVAKESVQRQAEESRLATALDAVDTGPTAKRVGAFTLLQRDATQKLDSASESGASERERRDALRLFRATLDILASYVKDPLRASDQPPPPSDATSPGFAMGDPLMPRDVYYAASAIKVMLGRKSVFYEVRGDSGDLPESDREFPALDLSGAHYYGVAWDGIDLAWLGGKYFQGVDLRRASLVGSKWRGSLKGAFLRCATLTGARFNTSLPNRTDLRDADLRRANLTNADLRNADLRGARLEGANLDGANLQGAWVTETDFTGAKLRPNALEKVKDREAAIGVGTQSQIPASETRADLECEAP